MTRMLYPPGFFGLQLTFARKITQLTQRPYQETILNMTALYRIVGLIGALIHKIPSGRTISKDCTRSTSTLMPIGVTNTILYVLTRFLPTIISIGAVLGMNIGLRGV